MTTLLLYGSKYGSTKETANRIADVLTGRGLEVDVRTTLSEPDLRQYDSAVIGSAIYAGRWRRPLRHFLRSNAKQLKDMPLWLFSVGPLGDPPTPHDIPKDALYGLEELAARGHELMPGVLDSAHLSFGDRAVIRALNVSDGDYRDWSAVTAWAEDVAADLAMTTL